MELGSIANIRYKEAEDVREVGLEPPVGDEDALLAEEGTPRGGGPVGEGASDMVERGRDGLELDLARDEAAISSDVKQFTRHSHCR